MELDAHWDDNQVSRTLSCIFVFPGRIYQNHQLYLCYQKFSYSFIFSGDFQISLSAESYFKL